MIISQIARHVCPHDNKFGEAAMRNYLPIALILLAPVSASAASWQRDYVVDKYEPAFYYGAKVGTMEPGSDCPKGTTPDSDYTAMLKTTWRSDAEVADILRSATTAVNGQFNNNREFRISSALRNRSFRKDIDTWVNPFTAPDPGMQEVTGKIGEGFNLDHNAKTGFVSPAGEKGVDNNLYRVMGCGMAYRGAPYSAYLSVRGNDKMLEGLYTIIIRISGNKDPMNDDDAVLEIGYSPDHVVKNSAGGAVPDYSFRIVKDAQYTRIKATVRNGVVQTVQTPEIHMPSFSWFENNRGESIFQQGMLRLVVNEDGTSTGLVGGYLDWRSFYGTDTFDTNSSAGTRETYYHENQIAKYYALKRNADGMRDPKTGQNMGISAAYRFTVQPAHVVDPDKPVAINEPLTSDEAIAYRDMFRKASLTAAIVSPPPRKGRHEDDAAPADGVKPQTDKQREAGNEVPRTTQ
jgi:hypothetical protein